MAETEKIIDKIKKLMSLAESEEALGNTGAAENISSKAQELLLKFKISHADIKKVQEEEPFYIPPIMGKTLVPNPFLRANAKTQKRILWFEELAKVVAEGYFCKAQVESGEVWFYGLDMDREVAIFMFSKIAERANILHDQEFKKLKSVVGMARITIGKKKGEQEEIPKVWEGDQVFTNSFHKGFREAIAEGLSSDDEIKKKALEDVDNYMRNNLPAYDYSYRRRYYSNSDEYLVNQEWKYVVSLGIKYGSRVSRKAGAIAEQSTKESLMKIESKGFVGEVYIIADDSGSMSSENKISQLQDGIRSFASEAIAQGQAVGLIKFGNEPTHLFSPKMEVDKTFISILNKLNASSGGTEMIPALKSAMSYFRNTRVKKTVFLVTDGHPTDMGGKEKVLETGLELKRNGIKIITLGCGSADEEFLKKLASDNMGELVDSSNLKIGMRKMAGLLSN